MKFQFLYNYLYMNIQNRRNTPCNKNAQLWYFVNAMNKVKTTKNPLEKQKYLAIVNYYLNNKLRNAL